MSVAVVADMKTAYTSRCSRPHISDQMLSGLLRTQAPVL